MGISGGKDAEFGDDDEPRSPIGIKFRQLRYDDHAAAVHLLVSAFVEEKGLPSMCDLSEKEVHQVCLTLVQWAQENGRDLSFVACDGDQIVGVALATDFALPGAEGLRDVGKRCPKAGYLLSAMKDAAEYFCHSRDELGPQTERLQRQKICQLFLVGVNPDQRRLGVASMLIKNVIRSSGVQLFDHVFAYASGTAAQQVFEKVGMKKAGGFDYADWRETDETEVYPLEGFTGPHANLAVYSYSLTMLDGTGSYGGARMCYLPSGTLC